MAAEATAVTRTDRVMSFIVTGLDWVGLDGR